MGHIALDPPSNAIWTPQAGHGSFEARVIEVCREVVKGMAACTLSSKFRASIDRSGCEPGHDDRIAILTIKGTSFAKGNVRYYCEMHHPHMGTNG